MRVALYARVSTEAQEARGTIGSQLEALRQRVADEGHELVDEFCDDGHSGARLDRPGLDAMRDAAETGLLDAVWCLSPDRLARVYAYQVIVIDELARHGVSVFFHDAPPLDNDPQARLLTQVQGVIAEYERAKIAERYRRGKLWRSRTGEVIAWKCPYGYRRIPRGADRPAHLEVYEPEAAVVRRIFEDSVHADLSIRQITRRLNQDCIPSPTGKSVWGTSTIGRILRNEAYIAGRSHAPGPPSPRGVDRHRRATHRGRGALRGRPTGQSRQLAMEPAADRARPLAAAGIGEVRPLRRECVVPQDARTQRDVPPLLLLPLPRSAQGRRGRPPLSRAQHPRGRARCLRLRSGLRCAASPRRAPGR
jgi:DNA invertase Pin-like site-specific DNA recombinase